MDLHLSGKTAVVTGASKGIVASGTATGRFTRPDEVAALVLLLASDGAGNATGADWTIDGGLVATL